MDDSSTIRRVLCQILEEAGHSAITAEDGKSAEQRTVENEFDIALVDLMLPDTNGIEVLKFIKASKPESIVIMLSGQGTYEVAVEAMNNGAFAYLKKPVNEDEVKATVARALERQLLLRENRARTKALEKANLHLIQANAELNKLTMMKSRFISIVAHELRTPLTVISSSSDTILHYFAELPIEKVKNYIGMIQDESHRLSRMIEELLDLSRIESGKVEFIYAKTDLKELVGGIFQQMNVVRPDLNMVLAFEDGTAEIETDRDKLGQVLLNLVGNALKYSPKGGRISVLGRADGANVVISVEDQGPGIPKEALDKVFEEFFRVQGEANRKVSGAGLGLTITKGILEAMGGRIWVESEFGKGSAFKFSVPRLGPVKIPEKAPPAQVLTPAEATGRGGAAKA